MTIAIRRIIAVCTISLGIWGCNEQQQQLYQLEVDRTCVECDLQGASLAYSNFGSRYRFSVSNAPLSTDPKNLARVQPVDLTRADLSNADLNHSNLTRVTLVGADLSNTNLNTTVLQEAQLQSADLSGADLRQADLRGADLRGANLENTDLRGADLRGANLDNVDLTDVIQDRETRWN